MGFAVWGESTKGRYQEWGLEYYQKSGMAEVMLLSFLFLPRVD